MDLNSLQAVSCQSQTFVYINHNLTKVIELKSLNSTKNSLNVKRNCSKALNYNKTTYFDPSTLQYGKTETAGDEFKGLVAARKKHLLNMGQKAVKSHRNNDLHMDFKTFTATDSEEVLDLQPNTTRDRLKDSSKFKICKRSFCSTYVICQQYLSCFL